MELTFTSRSYQDTIKFGIVLGKALRPGCVVGLIGELGAGKTCFTKGIAYGINGIPESEVTSPTFAILQEYEGNIPFYHFDAYRLSGVVDLETIGLDDYIGGEGATVIEWADRISSALPRECLFVYIDFINEHERRLTCKASGKLHTEVMERFRAGIGQCESGVHSVD